MIAIINIAFQACSVILSIIIICYSRIAKYDSKVSKSISTELINSLETSYFTEFSKSSVNFYMSNILSENLNVGPSKVRFGKWYGTLKGCGKDGQARALKESKKCEKDETFFEKIPEQYLYQYKGISIIAEQGEKSYIDLLYDNKGSIVEENQNCPQGKKKCGYIDTVNNILCLDNTLDCPISYISFSEKEPQNINNLEKIEGNTKTTLYYSKNPSSDSNKLYHIPSYFKLAEENICSMPDLYQNTFDLFVLDALNNDYSSKCTLKNYNLVYTIDKIRYTSLDNVNHYELYNENNIITLIEQFKNYGYNIDRYKNHNLYLYYRTHIGFKKSCLDKRKKKLNINELNKIYSVADNMEEWSNSVYTIIVTIIASLLNMYNFSGNIIEPLVKNAFSIVPSLIITIYTFLAKKYDDYYEELMECSDEVTNDIFNIMTSKIRKSGKKIKITSFLFIVLIIFLFIGFVLSCLSPSKD